MDPDPKLLKLTVNISFGLKPFDEFRCPALSLAHGFSDLRKNKNSLIVIHLRVGQSFFITSYVVIDML